MHFFWECVECQNYTLMAIATTTIKQSRPRLSYAHLNQQINSKPTKHIPTSCIWNSGCTILQHITVGFGRTTHQWLYIATTIKQSRPRLGLGYAYVNQHINSKPTNHIPTSCIWNSECTILQHITVGFGRTTHRWLYIATTIKQSRPRLG
jgi:hypothetical protein